MTTAQELLVEEYMHIAKSKAGKWCRNQNVLTYDELLSTAYMGLIRAAIAYDPSRKCHFVGFASICIENGIRDELRPAIKYKQKTSLGGGPEGAEDTSMEDDAYGFEDKSALLQAMEKLPEDDRTFLERYHAGTMTQRRLAEELDCSQKAVFSRLRDIHDFLRFQMETT